MIRRPSSAARLLKTSAAATAQAAPSRRATPGRAADRQAASPAQSATSAMTSSESTPSIRSMRTEATASRPRDVVAREGDSPDRVAADAGRQKRADERADEEDPHDRAERRSIRAGERAQQHEPAVGHQRAVDEHQQDGDANRPPVGAAGRRQHVRAGRSSTARRPSGQRPTSTRRTPPRLGRLTATGGGSVARWRAGSCFTWYARIRNFAYGTNCFIAPTFTWQGLRQVVQIVSSKSLAVGQVLGLEVQLLGVDVQHVADRLRVLAVVERRRTD